MISLDYTFMTEGAVRGGIADASLSTAARAFDAAHATVMNRWKGGELGFFDLPDDAQVARECQELTAAACVRALLCSLVVRKQRSFVR